MTYDGANEAVYLDGQPNYFTTRALNIVKPVTISLGAWYDSTDSAATAGGTFNFGGISNIAEFRIHDDSFTAADAARNYAAASPIYRTSPWDASCPTSWTGFSHPLQAVSVATSGSVYNPGAPSAWMRHCGFTVYTETNSSANYADASWYIVPGLDGAPGSVSFHPVGFPSV